MVSAWRWCNGPCGRQLSMDDFYRNGKGCPNSVCKACHRVAEKGRYRKAARRDGFLRKRRERETRRYATDPAVALRKCESVRASYWKAKVAA